MADAWEHMRATVVSAKNAEPSTQTDAAVQPTRPSGTQSTGGRASRNEEECGVRVGETDSLLMMRAFWDALLIVSLVSWLVIARSALKISVAAASASSAKWFLSVYWELRRRGQQQGRNRKKETKGGQGGETRRTRKILGKSCKSILERRLIRGIQTKSLVWILVKRAVCVHEKLFESRRFVHQFAASLYKRVRW